MSKISMTMDEHEMQSLLRHLGDPKDHDTGEYEEAEPIGVLTPGEMVKALRELAEWSQVELSDRCGIPQTVISAIEGGRVNLGAERAKMLARALRVHPSVILFSDWRGEQEYADDDQAA